MIHELPLPFPGKSSLAPTAPHVSQPWCDQQIPCARGASMLSKPQPKSPGDSRWSRGSAPGTSAIGVGLVVIKGAIEDATTYNVRRCVSDWRPAAGPGGGVVLWGPAAGPGQAVGRVGGGYAPRPPAVAPPAASITAPATC
ncbi:hypothetical protein HaLaN_21468 [Haematococcus lacustris]|uniref:Uncharacterized protein n=1 Tax=Haematococcus lacustris TaxID=44745 RepID=A0A699ZNM4_HAELA|nr:hypothetical protein HaLaN_21468 [Haematococcus lacustris]